VRFSYLPRACRYENGNVLVRDPKDREDHLSTMSRTGRRSLGSIVGKQDSAGVSADSTPLPFGYRRERTSLSAETFSPAPPHGAKLTIL